MSIEFDDAKRSFVNANLWRANLGLGGVMMPPMVPPIPAGSSVLVVSGAPLVCKWEFLPPNPIQPLYVAAWVIAGVNMPALPPPISKMLWIGNVPMTPAVNFSLESVLVRWGRFWAGSYLSLALAAGFVGTPPFQGLRVGTYR